MRGYGGGQRLVPHYMYMKIFVRSIPQEGKEIDLSSREGWVKALVGQALPTESPDLEAIQGWMMIQKIEETLHLSGELSLPIYPFCDRCGEPYHHKFLVSIDMHLTPADETNPTEDSSENDLNYATYNGGEINLGEIIREMIVLHRPIRFLCSEDCRGLCQECGTNLNKTSCNCRPRL